MDLRVMSGDRPTSGRSTVTAVAEGLATPRGDRAGAGAARGAAEDTVFLTVSVADIERTYTYGVPDGAALAAAVSSIIGAPGTSMASQSVNLRSSAATLLTVR